MFIFTPPPPVYNTRQDANIFLFEFNIILLIGFQHTCSSGTVKIMADKKRKKRPFIYFMFFIYTNATKLGQLGTSYSERVWIDRFIHNIIGF